MLTAKENMRQSIIKGGKPDRFVNNFEAINLMFHPQLMHNGGAPAKGIVNSLNAWGVTMSWPDNVPGAFPVHTADKIVVKDIEHWQDYVKAPDIEYTEEEWQQWGEEQRPALIDLYAYNTVAGDSVFGSAITTGIELLRTVRTACGRVRAGGSCRHLGNRCGTYGVYLRSIGASGLNHG